MQHWLNAKNAAVVGKCIWHFWANCDVYTKYESNHRFTKCKADTAGTRTHFQVRLHFFPRRNLLRSLALAVPSAEKASRSQSAAQVVSKLCSSAYRAHRLGLKCSTDIYRQSENNVNKQVNNCLKRRIARNSDWRRLFRNKSCEYTRGLHEYSVTGKRTVTFCTRNCSACSKRRVRAFIAENWSISAAIYLPESWNILLAAVCLPLRCLSSLMRKNH